MKVDIYSYSYRIMGYFCGIKIFAIFRCGHLNHKKKRRKNNKTQKKIAKNIWVVTVYYWIMILHPSISIQGLIQDKYKTHHFLTQNCENLKPQKISHYMVIHI